MKTRNSVASTGTTRIIQGSVRLLANSQESSLILAETSAGGRVELTPALLAVITSGTQFMG